MGRTYFQDFTRDDGSRVTVEYSYGTGSPTTYSPLSGASGGDDCEVEIVDVMPNTPEFETLCKERLQLEFSGPPGTILSVALMSGDLREKLEELDREHHRAKSACALTDAERERMEDWLCEHHVDEPDDDWEF